MVKVQFIKDVFIEPEAKRKQVCRVESRYVVTSTGGKGQDASDAGAAPRSPEGQSVKGGGDQGLSLGDMVSRGDKVDSLSDQGKSRETGSLDQSRAPLTRYLGRNLERTLSRGLSEELGRELNREASGLRERVLKGENPPAITREFTWSGQLDQSSNAGLSFPIGLRQHFQLRKSDFIDDKEKTDSRLNLKVEKFLNETPLKDDTHRTPAENEALDETRKGLAEATNEDEALSKALHLARLYQHLRYIEEAQKAAQLALGIDPDNIVGRQLFKELERMHPVDIGVTSPVTITLPQSVTKSALRRCIQQLAGGRVMVVGDLLIDELLEGKPERISREAPVLILEHVDTLHIPGGAANTANNVVALGGRCHAVGVCGADEYAQKLADMFTRHRIEYSLVPDVTRPTTVKTRILSKSHSLMQQLLRLDRIAHHQISAVVERALIEKIDHVAGHFQAVILSDYRAGVITDGVINACRAIASQKKLHLIVDAQDNFARFKDVTLLTPNQPDAEKALGFSIDSKESLARAGSALLAATNAEALLITRGPEGMVLFRRGEPMVEVPVFNRSDVFDVTGAGDTVVATMALALVTGSSYVEAMALGNLAAGIVVRKSGTAVTSQNEMLDTLETLSIAD